MFSVFHKLLLGLSVGLAMTACEREQRDFHATASTTGPDHFQRDAFDVAQGKRLFNWMNCTGCHSHGGGGIGPALMDRDWLYGASLQDIYASIRDGRPKGMPAWHGRMTDEEIWQVAAFVRSMGRYVAKDVAPSRDDAMDSGKSENRRPVRTPRQVEAAP
jgi:cytochrome c oxidase cbb3-type subunit 3